MTSHELNSARASNLFDAQARKLAEVEDTLRRLKLLAVDTLDAQQKYFKTAPRTPEKQDALKVSLALEKQLRQACSEEPRLEL